MNISKINLQNTIQYKSLKIPANQTRGKINFTSDDSFQKSNKDDNNKKNSKINISPKLIALIGIGLVSLIAFLKYSNNKKINKETIDLYDKITKAFKDNGELSLNTQKTVESLNMSNAIQEFSPNNAMNNKALKSLEYLIAMDRCNMSPKGLELPDIIAFKNMDNSACSCLIRRLFEKSPVNVIDIDFTKEQESITETIDKMRQKHPNERIFIHIKKQNKLAKRICGNSKDRNKLISFISSLKTKNVSLFISDNSILKALKSSNLSRTDINFKVIELNEFLRASY